MLLDANRLRRRVRRQAAVLWFLVLGAAAAVIVVLSTGREPSCGQQEVYAAAPARARWSSPLAPRTITCLHGSGPPGWLTPPPAG